MFKIFVEYNFFDRPCMTKIPSRSLIYMYFKFHEPSTVIVISGNTKTNIEMSHVSPIFVPRLNEPSIHGPYYAPCNNSLIIFRPKGPDETFLFSFLKPNEEFINSHPDPLSCDYNHKDENLRKHIGYSNTPWIKQKKSIKEIYDTVSHQWKTRKSKKQN